MGRSWRIDADSELYRILAQPATMAAVSKRTALCQAMATCKLAAPGNHIACVLPYWACQSRQQMAAQHEASGLTAAHLCWSIWSYKRRARRASDKSHKLASSVPFARSRARRGQGNVTYLQNSQLQRLRKKKVATVQNLPVTWCLVTKAVADPTTCGRPPALDTPVGVVIGLQRCRASACLLVPMRPEEMLHRKVCPCLL